MVVQTTVEFVCANKTAVTLLSMVVKTTTYFFIQLHISVY